MPSSWPSRARVIELARRALTSILDFVDARWGYPVQDIANCLAQWLDEDSHAELEAAFLKGYAGQAGELGEIPALLPLAYAHRQLDMLSFVVSSDALSESELTEWLPVVARNLRRLGVVHAP